MVLIKLLQVTPTPQLDPMDFAGTLPPCPKLIYECPNYLKHAHLMTFISQLHTIFYAKSPLCSSSLLPLAVLYHHPPPTSLFPHYTSPFFLYFIFFVIFDQL